jgi:hypothetical protein
MSATLLVHTSSALSHTAIGIALPATRLDMLTLAVRDVVVGRLPAPRPLPAPLWYK